MSISKFIEKVCVQTAVYWGSPMPDGVGGFTYADPVEIKCRWDESIKVITSISGEEVISTAQVLVTQDLDYLGVLFLGTLSDLDALDIELEEHASFLYPKQLENVYFILAREKVSMIKSLTDFVRTVYLSRTKL